LLCTLIDTETNAVLTVAFGAAAHASLLFEQKLLH